MIEGKNILLAFCTHDSFIGQGKTHLSPGGYLSRHIHAVKEFGAWCRIEFYMHRHTLRALVEAFVHAVYLACQLHSWLIGKGKEHAVAILYFAQVFFKYVEVAFHSLVVADLHQRSLHVGITSQRGCQLTHRTAHRSTQGEDRSEMSLGYRCCRNSNLLQLTGNTHHTGTSHLIIFPCHLHILLHPSAIGSQQLLAFHLLSGRLTLLISGKVFPLQRKNISILYRSNNLTFSDLLSFLHVNILHHATHQ